MWRKRRTSGCHWLRRAPILILALAGAPGTSTVVVAVVYKARVEWRSYCQAARANKVYTNKKLFDRLYTKYWQRTENGSVGTQQRRERGGATASLSTLIPVKITTTHIHLTYGALEGSTLLLCGSPLNLTTSRDKNVLKPVLQFKFGFGYD